VRRVLAVCLFALGLAAAGIFSAAVIADAGTTTSSTATSTTAATTTTATDTTTTATTIPSTPATTTAAPGREQRVLPSGVRVAGIDIGGLTPAVAVAVVRTAFARLLPIVIDRTRLVLEPTKVATAYAALAVARARNARPSASVGLTVNVDGAAVRSWAARVAERYDRKSADATLALRNGRPKLTPAVTGRVIPVAALTREVVSALQTASRTPIRLRPQLMQPKVPTVSLSTVIVINRGLNRLQLFNGAHLVRTFPVATGQAIYPTPKGRFNIIVKWKNPWWYPPTQDAWARGLKPVPPGPGNPLGTRWMGLSSPGIGIHGTDEPGSIGYSASHGCIRMQVADAEWLYDRVDVGTTVFIL
jgi:lipoprotein-anchoring transpeptidase ErfK/SrfK